MHALLEVSLTDVDVVLHTNASTPCLMMATLQTGPEYQGHELINETHCIFWQLNLSYG